MSIRGIADFLKVDRKTIRKYVIEYEEQRLALAMAVSEDERIAIQNHLKESPAYDSSSRTKRKLNDVILQIIKDCLNVNESRISNGIKKQIYDVMEIWKKIKNDGHDISYSTIRDTVSRLRQTNKECFIRQEYDYGQSVQFDYGEVKLNINGVFGTYYLAVFSIQKINYRWAYIYNSSNQLTLFDSHNRFIEHIGGIHKEFVYDNMRNIVSQFIGREKVINLETLKMANFYQFKIRLTNCRKGNEKGHVEGSVDFIRKCTFINNIDFNSLADANSHLAVSLKEINVRVSADELSREIAALKPFIGKYDYSEQTAHKVNPYSCVAFQNVFYSVPENLISQTVSVRSYVNHIDIYFKEIKIASHQKALVSNTKYCLNIEHFLQTLSKKRGALHNSTALKQLQGRLKDLYHLYYTSNPKEFINLFFLIKSHGLESVLNILNEYMLTSTKIPSNEYLSSRLVTQKEKIDVENQSQLQLNSYNAFL